MLKLALASTAAAVGLAVTLVDPFGVPGARGVAAADVAPEWLEVTRGDVRPRLSVAGELHPVRSTTISSQLSGDQGTVVHLAEDGAAVSTGDVLVRLDRTPFEQAHAEAAADVERRRGQLDLRRHSLEWEQSQAEQKVAAATFELELATLELRRFEKGDGPLELARLKADAAAATAALAQQERYVSELEPLLSQGFVQQAEIDQLAARRDEAARASVLASRQAEAYERYIFPSRQAGLEVGVNRATAALDQVRLGVASKVAEAEAAVRLAERDLAAAQAREAEAAANLERTVVKAPSDGMFVLTEEIRAGGRRKPRVGDSVWEGQQIAYLPDLSALEIRSNVREVDLHRVAPGFAARARFDAYPDLELAAEVRGLGVLASRVTSTSTEKAFAVTIDLEGSDPRLRPGMSARVEIEAGDRLDVVVLPLVALWEDRGETWVWLVDDGRLIRREVRVGARDHGGVEVLEGLAVGDRVSPVGPE